MKRSASFIACMLLLAMLLVGCTGGGTTTPPSTTPPPTTPPITTPSVTTSVCDASGHVVIPASCKWVSRCAVCNLELGSTLGEHDYEGGSCTVLGVCSVCGKSEERTLGHSFVDADCTTPKHCTVCDATEGKALGHSYDSETDRTCKICKEKRDVDTKYYGESEATTVSLDAKNSIYRTAVSATANGVYYIRVYAIGKDANHRLTLRLTDGTKTLCEYSYFVSSQLTEVCLPFTASGSEAFVELSVSDGGEFSVSTPKLIPSNTTYAKTRSGTYLVLSNEWEEITVTASDTEGLINDKERVLDSVVIGDYMYVLGGKQLHTLKRSGDSFVKIGESAELGELRQMCPTGDGKGLIVVARNFGAYAFDLTDPEHPVIASHIDTLEMASGLDIFGKHLYVADRQFGVTIFDISDISNPVFISNIPTGETQNVCYSNGYVYAGVWAECLVRVCDVRDVDDPKQVCEIKLSGRGDGVYVKDNILYAATGQFGKGENSPRENPGYGLGNGLELWDVSNPAKPTRLSVVRSDGANYPGNPDLWRVYTVGGHYAVYSSVFCGAYIYDVSDPTSPVRIAHYQILSATALNGLWTDKYNFPYQNGTPIDESKRPYPIVDSYVDGDNIYLCAGENKAGNNLYAAKLPFSIGTPDPNDSDPKAQDDTYDRSYVKADYEKLFGEGTKSYLCDGQVRGAALLGDYLYLAAGTQGVIILDKRTLTEVKSYPSFDITKDVQIYDKYLYTAEATAGIAIYEIDEGDGTRLTLVSQKPIANIVQLQLSPDARYALAHVSNTSALLDLRDKTNPSVYYSDTSFNMVYQYQMSIGCIDNRYLLMSCSKKTLQVFDFGPGGSYEEPKILRWQDKSTAVSGLCADGKYAIVSSGKTVYRIDLSSPDFSLDKTVPNITKGVKYTDMSQMPVVIGDYLFATLRRAGTYYILKLSADRSTATTHKALTLHGNPGMIVSDGERYYLPLAYAGIVSFTLPEYTAK